MKLPIIIHPDWQIEHLFEDKRMEYIKQNLLRNCYPENKKHIFRALFIPPQDVKVVILGEEPYPKPKLATGYAFAVPKDMDAPCSLKIIFDEISDNTGELAAGLSDDVEKELHYLVKQGVMLLNTSLTVKPFTPGSHNKYWKWFIFEIIKILMDKADPVWMLWGKHAQQFRPDSKYVLTAGHPATECYGGKYNGSFLGCKHFIIANTMLSKQGKMPIDWVYRKSNV